MGDNLKLTWLFCGEPGKRTFVAAAGLSARKLAAADYGLVWFLGPVTVAVEGKTYQVQENDVVMVQPGQVSQIRGNAFNSAFYHGISFSAVSLPSTWPPREGWPIVFHLPEGDIVRPIFEYILENAPRDFRASDARLKRSMECALETLLTALICGPMRRSRGLVCVYPAAVQRVLQWVRDIVYVSPSKKVTLEDLAQIAGVSSAHLCRLFCKNLGHSPLETLYLYRLSRSLIGLRAGQKIETLAHNMGFANASHYSKRFTLLFGKTPHVMRQAMADGLEPQLPSLP